MIKLIVNNIKSRRDTSGNVYHVTQLTHTATGNKLSFCAVAPCNSRNLIPLAYGEFYCHDTELPKKEVINLRGLLSYSNESACDTHLLKRKIAQLLGGGK